MLDETGRKEEEIVNPKISSNPNKKRVLIAVIVLIIAMVTFSSFVFLKTREQLNKSSTVIDQSSLTESESFSYGGNFYRIEDKVFINDPRNVSINNIELSNADPDTFKYLQGLSGYDKDNFHYLNYVNEARSYVPVSVPINSEIKQLFDLIESPGEDLKIVWTSSNDVIFENVTYKRLSEYGDFNAFRIEIFEILNNGNLIGYIWANGINKTNVANNKQYIYTDSSTTGYKRAVYEVSYGNQPEMILDIEPDKTTFRPGGSKIYYTKSYNSLDLYEYDTATRKERHIHIQDQDAITSSSRITLSPDEKYLLVQVADQDEKERTLLVSIDTGEIEIAEVSEVTRMGGDFPFAVSPKNDKVFFLAVPYEGYLFTNPTYVKKDDITGTWSGKISIQSINMEVGGGWNIETGQWSISPSGRYLAVADSSENSINSCAAGPGGPQSTHNIVKAFDMETLETQILGVENPNENLILNSWELDESGIFATKYKIEIDPDEGCWKSTGEGIQEFYPR